MKNQQSQVTCSGLGNSFRAKVVVVTFADDDQIFRYAAELQRSELDRFCEYAGLPNDKIAVDQDGRTGYDHEAIISDAMLMKLGFQRANE